MKNEFVLAAIGAIVGGLAGWLYWKYVGCSSGTCAITSRPISSTIYGAIMGILLFYTAAPQKKHTSTKHEKITNNDRNA